MPDPLHLARSRPLPWASLNVGAVFDAFAAHCADDLEDLEVVERSASVLEVRRRDERGRAEIAVGALPLDGPLPPVPRLLLADTAGETGLVARFLEDTALRERVCVVDLALLEKVGTVRSSLLVYLEWFLRERYGVKLLPHEDLTRGLLARGTLSLGMG
ncbi:MAG: hypothetical protein EXQ77_01755 [Thermoleophilia bacterium]|nr:hypothetical protein [Thermoleophilia bacterium]